MTERRDSAVLLPSLSSRVSAEAPPCMCRPASRVSAVLSLAASTALTLLLEDVVRLLCQPQRSGATAAPNAGVRQHRHQRPQQGSPPSLRRPAPLTARSAHEGCSGTPLRARTLPPRQAARPSGQRAPWALQLAALRPAGSSAVLFSECAAAASASGPAALPASAGHHADPPSCTLRDSCRALS